MAMRETLSNRGWAVPRRSGETSGASVATGEAPSKSVSSQTSMRDFLPGRAVQIGSVRQS